MKLFDREPNPVRQIWNQDRRMAQQHLAETGNDIPLIRSMKLDAKLGKYARDFRISRNPQEVTLYAKNNEIDLSGIPPEDIIELDPRPYIQRTPYPFDKSTEGTGLHYLPFQSIGSLKNAQTLNEYFLDPLFNALGKQIKKHVEKLKAKLAGIIL